MKTLFSAGNSYAAQDLAAEVRQFILDSFPLARKKQLKNSDPLLESGIIDSQGVLDVVIFIEQRFATTVDDEELVPENFQTIEGIAAFVRSKTTRSAGMD
jgi:acyl carrier protein